MKIFTKILIILTVTLFIISCDTLNDASDGADDGNDTENVLENVKFTRINASGSSITVKWTDPVNDNFDHINLTCSNGDTDEIEPGVNIKTFTVSPEMEYEISFISVYNDGRTSDANHKVYVTTPKTGAIGYTPVYTASELIDAMYPGTNGQFILIADLDLSTMSTRYWEPIGSNDNPFKGIFDGNYHEIKGLTITSSESGAGFFASTMNAEIRNVNINNAKIIGSSYTGALIGYARDTVIYNCNSSGSVDGGNYTGGLIGYIHAEDGYYTLHSKILNSYSTCNVRGHNDIGGLVGNMYAEKYSISVSDCYSTGKIDPSGKNVGGLAGTVKSYDNDISISNCYSTGYVHGNSVIGGLIGCSINEDSDSKIIITDCHTTGDVNSGTTTTGNYVGGLIGHSINEGTVTISNCYSTGKITTTLVGENIGGLIGSIDDNNDGSNRFSGTVSISNCYSKNEIRGENYVGGLIGNLEAEQTTIKNCYAGGNISGKNYVGGLIGYDFNYDSMLVINHIISDCYAAGSISGSDYVGGLIGYFTTGDVEDDDITVSNCYSSGSITGTGVSIGGAFGYSTYCNRYYGSDPALYVDLVNLYWNRTINGSLYDIGKVYDPDTDSSYNIDVAVITGLTVNMKDAANYSGFDFVNVWDISSTTNNGYPFLRNMP